MWSLLRERDVETILPRWLGVVEIVAYVAAMAFGVLGVALAEPALLTIFRVLFVGDFLLRIFMLSSLVELSRMFVAAALLLVSVMLRRKLDWSFTYTVRSVSGG